MTVTALDYHPTAAAVIDDPYPYYTVLRRDAPVLHLPECDMWVVSRYADVRGVMHDHSTFSSRAMARRSCGPFGTRATRSMTRSTPHRCRS